MIYPEKLAARFESNSNPLYNPSQAALIAELESACVTVYDAAPLLFALKSELPKGSYLETDTHWTPTAMQRSAAQLAELINSKVNFDNPANSEWTLTPENITRHGDIFDMLKLPDSQNFYKPESATVQRVTASEGNDWRAAADAEVLLLGDSFVNIYSLDGMGWGKSAGFAEHLSAALKRPLDRISLNDNGSFATRQELATDLARGNDRLANKKVVVWEFAAREFASGDWKAIPLELRQGRTTTADKSADTASFVVNATIKSMPAPPVPGAVPYQDAVIGMQVEITGVESGAYDLEEQPEALVYAWVMRKNQLTPVARYRAGQKLKLALRPWEDVRAEVGSFNRLEPDDPMALMLEPYWAEE
jgi:alginate O-acetyltransferase complex protein AlgJ